MRKLKHFILNCNNCHNNNNNNTKQAIAITTTDTAGATSTFCGCTKIPPRKDIIFKQLIPQIRQR